MFVLAQTPFLPLQAQDLSTVDAGVESDEPLLLEADTLVYDNDRQTVTAVGGVQIDYGGNRLVAQRVIYDRRTRRLVARGDVELVDDEGTRVYSDEIDVTDDFRDGFVNAMRVETVDKTYFAAESGERVGGVRTTFNNGVYTACEPCEDKPDQPQLWRIKAQKIIWNGETKTVRFERARFEFFGFPLARLPAFEIADPTVKRKSGFLFPRFAYNSELGFGVGIPYYFALSPTYDLTVTGTGYTSQGFLGEAEWRQRFENGQYSLKIAGIHQLSPDEFDFDEVDSTVTNRGMIGSQGEFRINPMWTFGWDVMVQSDENFSNTYEITGYDDYYRDNQVYLTGLNGRNYFDLRFHKFDIQASTLPDRPTALNDKQPWVLPSFDYSKTFDEPVAGGELTLDVNSQVIYRDELHVAPVNALRPPNFREAEAVRGIAGTSARLTAESEWKRNMVMPGGLMVTPVLAARGDAIGLDASADSVAAINSTSTFLTGADYSYNGDAYGDVSADIRSAYYRAMATAGLEARWPILFSTSSASHVLEPVAQIFVRPNAPYGSSLGIPNEDAQSLVFDATTLFDRDKFSGYDRIEGGTRANLGLRYSGSFANGWTLNALFGQSYHLAGDNPFASPDLVSVGAYSGLETDVSDFVGMVGFTTPDLLTMSLGGRFDEETFEMRRGEVAADLDFDRVRIGATYAYIQQQPLYGFEDDPSRNIEGDRREFGGRLALQFNENWRAYGSATYDLVSETLSRSSIGFAYDDECFTYAMIFQRTVTTVTKEESTSIGFNISLRTIGDFGTGTGQFSR
nr:LPS-assembly protein LptD [Mesorhizobium xinjiangense]